MPKVTDADRENELTPDAFSDKLAATIACELSRQIGTQIIPDYDRYVQAIHECLATQRAWIAEAASVLQTAADIYPGGKTAKRCRALLERMP